MKSLLSCCLMLAFVGTSLAQSYMAQVKPTGSKEWGYMNEKGEMVIPAQYRRCYAFGSNGLAATFDHKKLAFVNVSGEVIEPIYPGLLLNQGNGFYDGLIAVKSKTKKAGYLNGTGEIAIQLKYDDVTIFNDGYAMAKLDGAAYIVDTEGKDTKVDIANFSEIKPFSEGLAPAKHSSGKFGFVNTKGEVVIDAKFGSVGYFSSGFAWARSGDKIGYIDVTGKWVIEPKFDSGNDFDPVSGLARVKMEDKWGYTDAEGNMIHMIESTRWGNFSEGLAVGRIGDKVGYFDKNEEWVIEPKFEAAKSFYNGFAQVKMNGLWGMINMAGEIVIPCNYAGVKKMAKINE